MLASPWHNHSLRRFGPIIICCWPFNWKAKFQVRWPWWRSSQCFRSIPVSRNWWWLFRVATKRGFGTCEWHCCGFWLSFHGAFWSKYTICSFRSLISTFCWSYARKTGNLPTNGILIEPYQFYGINLNAEAYLNPFINWQCYKDWSSRLVCIEISDYSSVMGMQNGSLYANSLGTITFLKDFWDIF